MPNQTNPSQPEKTKQIEHHEQASPQEIAPDEVSGTIEDSIRVATGGTGAVTETPSGHPTEIPHPREETGRHADESTKH